MSTRELIAPTNGQIVAAALRAGKAFPVMYFPSPDSAPSKFVVIDATQHFGALECAECGEMPSITYSVDKNPMLKLDDMQWVALGCKCAGAITLFIGGPLFSRARGAMGSLARSWWNAMRDRAGHPDDLGAYGGMLVTWESFEKHMSGDAASAETVPAGPGE